MGFAHTGKDIGQGTKKKKKGRGFFPDAIWPLGHKCPVGQCEMAAAKKKKGIVLPRRHSNIEDASCQKKKRELYCQGARHYKIDFHYDFRAEASYRLKKRASDDKASYRLKKKDSASPGVLQHKTSPGPIWPLSTGHSSM